jgi:hypothetical protein
VSDRGGTGNWNRAGRRSGGDRPKLIRGGAPAPDALVIGPCCALGHHKICEGCYCRCHSAHTQKRKRDPR